MHRLCAQVVDVLALRCALVWEVPRLEAGDDLDESLRQLPGTQVRKVREEDDRHWASLCRQPSVLEAQRMMRHASSINVSSCKLQHNRTLSDFQPGTCLSDLLAGPSLH